MLIKQISVLTSYLSLVHSAPTFAPNLKNQAIFKLLLDKMLARYHECDLNVLDGKCLTAQTVSVFSSVDGYYV